MIKAHHPIYTVYAAEDDMTFIMQDHYEIGYGESEVKGRILNPLSAKSG